MKIAILVSGGGTNLQAIIDSIKSGYLSEVEISLVVASNGNAYALKRASENGINSCVHSKKDFDSNDLWDSELLKLLKSSQAELVVLAGYLSLLGPMVIKEYSNRIINIHPSLIPSFCGAGMYGIRPHEAALKKGVKVSGATVHFVNENYDEGPILIQKAVNVLPSDTPELLQQRIMVECERKILPEAIKLISEGKVFIENNLAIVR